MEQQIRIVRLDDASTDERASAPRTREADAVARARAGLIERVARGECSVPDACREAGISRARFYQLRDAYLRAGVEGLRPKPRPKRLPARPDRRVSLATEEAIVAYALLHPTHGKRSIAEALSRPELGGLRVSPHGVGGVLRRAGLSRAERRLSVAPPRQEGLPVALPRHEDRSPRAGRSLDGDERFARLYRRYRGYVYSVCLRRLGDPAKAEDAAQETFARIYASLSRFDARQKVRPWIRVIAVNVCTTIYHRSVRVETHELTDEAWLERQGGEEPPDAMIRKERHERLERALAALPPRQRRALLLHALDGWNYGDIASAEGTSIQAVKSLLFRARESLRHAREAGAFGLAILPGRRLCDVLSMRRIRMRMAVSRALRDDPVSAGAQTIVSFVAAMAILVCGAGFSARQPAEAAPGARIEAASRPASGVRAPDARTARSPGARGGSQPSTLPASADAGDGALLDGFLDPGRNATPENTRFSSIDPSPSYDRDRTVFAAGNGDSGGTPVVFVTHDGGARWRRLAAAGLVDGIQDLALPPAYPRDPRIFVLDSIGLKESTDHGASFHLVGPLPAGTKSSSGEMTISPGFDADDPRILLGSRIGRVVEYRDDSKLLQMTAAPLAPPNVSFEPAFSPDYATDGSIVVGAAETAVRAMDDPDAGGASMRSAQEWQRQPAYLQSTVHRCDHLGCDVVVLDGGAGIPRIRLSPSFREDRLGFAVLGTKLFRTRDGARTFTNLPLPAGEMRIGERIGDVAMRGSPGIREPVIVASLVGFNKSAHLYKSTDGGDTWIPLAVNPSGPTPYEGFQTGFDAVRFAGTNGPLFAAGRLIGLVCSSDDGETWATRC